jgi:hypothetical protein
MFARFALLSLAGFTLMAQELPVLWDELVASDGKLLVEHSIGSLVKVVREVKDDQTTPEIQEENYRRQLK